MNIATGLAALTALSTFVGGFLAHRSRDRLHLTLGLAAGLLFGLVAFDLLPEVFRINTATVGGVPAVSIAFVSGFFALHFTEQIFASHEPSESDYGHEHNHASNIAGTFGGVAMAGHVFLDGVALGVAFQVSHALGFAVFIAILAHASFLIKGGRWKKRALWLLGVDALMRVSGATLGAHISLSPGLLGIYLAVFSGFVIYLATSHILPEAHARHPSKLTMLATVIGVVFMWLVVGQLGQL
jgi:ZIP family zinc transporter